MLDGHRKVRDANRPRERSTGDAVEKWLASDAWAFRRAERWATAATETYAFSGAARSRVAEVTRVRDGSCVALLIRR